MGYPLGPSKQSEVSAHLGKAITKNGFLFKCPKVYVHLLTNGSNYSLSFLANLI
jgi:hypothetical protein